jgi:hypothetical protein
MKLIEEFSLRQATVTCPVCETTFATPHLINMPIITAESPIETDLHRALPNGAIRAALIGSCEACGYSWWITAFKVESVLSDSLTADEYSVERLKYPRKFADAFMTGRRKRVPAQELAMLALNGGWCAREAGLPHERWLELAHEELTKAIADRSAAGNRGYYNYIMGELCRQQKNFEAAISHFNKVTSHSRLPRELVVRQKVQATAGDPSPTRLPPYLVEAIFCPRKPRKPFLHS